MMEKFSGKFEGLVVELNRKNGIIVISQTNIYFDRIISGQKVYSILLINNVPGELSLPFQIKMLKISI